MANPDTLPSVDKSKIGATFNNKTADILLAVVLGIALLWYVACLVIACTRRYPNIACASNPGLVERDALLRTGDVAELLIAAIGFAITYLRWPQAQQNVGIATIIMAQASALGWLDVSKIRELPGKLIEVLAICITLGVAIDGADSYQWQTTHNPKYFCLISLVLIGAPSICWTIMFLVGSAQTWRKSKKCITCLYVLLVSIPGAVLGIIAASPMILPYKGTMILGIAADFVGMVLCLAVCFVDEVYRPATCY